MEAQMQSSTISRLARRPAWLRPGLLWFAFDLIVPTVLLYAVIWNDGSLYLALLVSAALSAVTSLVAYWRGTAGQRFAPVMLTLALAGLAIALVTGSDRFLLARESVLTAVVACWFFGSLWMDRPLAYQFTRPLLEGRWGRRWGLPDTSWESAWESVPRFRHIWRVLTVMWGVAMLIDAVLRVVIAYTWPIPSVPGAQLGLMIGTVLVMQVVTHVYFARAGLWRLLWRASENPSKDARSMKAFSYYRSHRTGNDMSTSITRLPRRIDQVIRQPWQMRAMAIVDAIIVNVIILIAARLLTGDYPVATVGDDEQTIGFAQVILVTAVVGLVAWGLLALLERMTDRAATIWTVIAAVVFLLSMLGPLGSGVGTSAKVVLALMHVGAAVTIIPLMLRSTRTER